MLTQYALNIQLASSQVTSDHEEPINNANFLRLAVNVRGGRPSAQQRACHQPKSIMVNMGEIRLDSLEQRRIVNTQVRKNTHSLREEMRALFIG